MFKVWLSAAALMLWLAGHADAQTSPGAQSSPAMQSTPSGQPSASEAAFVAGIQSDLNRRFATTAAAERAGYLRFTREDKTGAISYANRTWTSADPAHPSQLWYDVHGKLLGADYSVLQVDRPTAPVLWGVAPERWSKISAHVHYGLVQPGGATKFGEVGVSKLSAAADSAQNPQPQDLVAAGVAPSAKDVRFVFLFPAIWDLTVWVLPNPNGAFAESNPNVKPSAAGQPSM